MCNFAPEMTTKRLLLTLTTLLTVVSAQGQYLRLAGDAERTALYLDLDKIWNYNLYEHSRWGGGLRLSVHDLFCADGYIGYGTKDQKFKWGLTLDALHPSVGRHIYLSALYDLEAAGSRRLQNASLSDIGSLSAFMSHRMSHVERVTIGWRQDISQRLQLGAAIRYSAEERLFDAYGLVYPTSYYNPNAKTLFGFTEVLFDLKLNRHLHFHLLLGDSEESYNNERMRYLRMLLQYDNDFNLNPFTLHIFAQGGWSDGLNHAVPYSRMFDLGGTWSSPVYFRNSLLTARPNEFTANAFAFVSVVLQTSKPLYSTYSSILNAGSNPTPFIGFNAAWGALWGMNANGQRAWQQLGLQAPYLGIVEPLVGINGILRWGLVDYGFATAYRVTPLQAPYHYTEPLDNLTLLLTATITL